MYSFLNKFAATIYKRFSPHLNNVSITLFNLKCLSRTATIELLQKEIPEFTHLNCSLQIRQIRIQLITEYGKYCNRKGTKHTSLIWTNWYSDWEWSGPVGQWASGTFSISRRYCGNCYQWHRRRVQISYACFVHLLLRYFQHSVINLIRIWRIWKPHFRWDKFWSLF